MANFLKRNFKIRQWWASAPSVPGIPGTPPPDPEPELATLTLSDGGDLATASFTTLTNERNKPSVIEDVVIASDTGVIEVGAILTATITGHVSGPYSPGAHEYQWYTVDTIMNGTLTAIVGATLSTYTILEANYTKYITCRARYVQVGGANNTSEYMYAELTDVVTAAAPAGDGDIIHAWEDFFNIETAASVPANWNDAGVSPTLINLGTGVDWTTVEATKPSFSIDKLVFANAHKIAGYSVTDPAVWELWVKVRFTGGNGHLLCMGNQQVFGMNSSVQYTSTGLVGQAGDTLEHVFRIVLNGANSIFQVDGGTEVTFTDTSTAGSLLVMGQSSSPGGYGDFEIKRFQRTAHNTLLTPQEVTDKWLFHLGI